MHMFSLMADTDASDWCTNSALYYARMQLAHRTALWLIGIK
jgi:hypothetical protein